MGAGSITLAWDASSGADGYKLYIGTASGVYTYPGSPIDVGNVLIYQVTLLTNGTYYYVITAYNTFGESGFSTEIVDTISGDIEKDFLDDEFRIAYQFGDW